MNSAGAAVLRLERRLPAPRTLVFAAMTDPRLIRRWMCPAGFQVRDAEADARIGGQFRIVMQAPDGTAYPASGRYVEVRPPQVLEFTWSWGPAHTLAGIETRVRVELDERDGATHLLMTHSGLPDMAERESHRGGWTGALDNLQRLVEGETARWTT